MLMKFVSRITVGLLLGLLTFGVSVASAAEDASLETVKKRGSLIVGFCAAYPPFESRNEKTGQFEGFDVDLGKALAERLGVKVEYRDTEWPGLIAGMNKGDFDVLITCMSKSETRGQNVNMSDVYFELPDVVVVRKGETAIKSIADLKDKVVGVQMGSAAEQSADKLQGLKEIRRYNYNPEAFLDLGTRRIDALIVGHAYAVTQNKSSEGNFHVVGPVSEPAEVVMVLKKDADSLTTALNGALKSMRNDGEHQKLVSKWLTAE